MYFRNQVCYVYLNKTSKFYFKNIVFTVSLGFEESSCFIQHLSNIQRKTYFPISAHVIPSDTTTALLNVRRGDEDSEKETSKYFSFFSCIFGRPSAILVVIRMRAAIVTNAMMITSLLMHRHLKKNKNKKTMKYRGEKKNITDKARSMK